MRDVHEYLGEVARCCRFTPSEEKIPYEPHRVSRRYAKTAFNELNAKIVIFGTRGAKFLPSTSALARVEEQKFRPQVANITFWHE